MPTRSAKFGEFDLLVGNRLAQRNAPRPFERLLRGHRPRHAIAEAAHPLVAKRGGHFGIRQRACRAPLAARGGNLRVVEIQFGIVLQDLRDERIQRDGRRVGVGGWRFCRIGKEAHATESGQQDRDQPAWAGGLKSISVHKIKWILAPQEMRPKNSSTCEAFRQMKGVTRRLRRRVETKEELN